jgi:hypothetical protein
MRKLRERLTYANVMATIAVFIALGGASYAATQLPKNSVGSNQIKKGAVTGAKVRSGSLLASDFKAGQLPQGPRGAEGPPGPKGEPGATNVVTRYGPEEELKSGHALVSYAECHADEAVTGGGYDFTSGAPASPSYYIGSDNPSLKEQLTPTKVTYKRPPDGSPATGWSVFIENETGETFSFRAYVMCASP